MRADSARVYARLEADRAERLNGGSVTPKSPYITVEEAAERLGYTPRTIRELCRTSRIPHRKLAGGSSPCKFLLAELDAWVDGAAVAVVTPAGHPGRVVKVANGV